MRSKCIPTFKTFSEVYYCFPLASWKYGFKGPRGNLLKRQGGGYGLFLFLPGNSLWFFTQSAGKDDTTNSFLSSLFIYFIPGGCCFEFLRREWNVLGFLRMVWLPTWRFSPRWWAWRKHLCSRCNNLLFEFLPNTWKDEGTKNATWKVSWCKHLSL